MEIRISSAALQTGDFTPAFTTWITVELKRRVEQSEAFVSKYGKDCALEFAWVVLKRFKEPRILLNHVPEFNAIRCHMMLPFTCTSYTPKEYAKVVKQFLEGVTTVLRRIDIDPTGVLEDTPKLLTYFVSHPGMLEAAPARQEKKSLPKWEVPKDLQKRINKEGTWGSDRFDPIRLTVMSGTTYQGRNLPLVWQIEFDPSDEQWAAANEKIEALDIEPDGDGWAEVIERKFSKRYPKLAGQLHSDSESSTCVLWVESENVCERLVEIVWSLIHSK